MLRAYLKLLRVYQWTKSGFIFLPLIFSDTLPEIVRAPFGEDAFRTVIRLGGAFLAFSFAASCVYIFNDYRDREEDRRDPKKKHRPIASGKIKPSTAILTVIILLVLTVAICSRLPQRFQVILLIYLAQNIFYTLVGKKIILIDVFMIAIGFVLRVVAGAAVLEITASPWLLSCTLFLALFLGFFKRYYEVHITKPEKLIGGSYSADLLKHFIGITASLAVMNYAIYTLEGRYAAGKLYWTIPFVCLGIFRYYSLMDKPDALDDGNPTDLLLADPFLIAVIAAWVAVSALLILGIF